uniref:aspartate-alanine antiporter-like transporter n=1 Tax=Flexistipes sinusarabici TaxID=2352 RepID=UPI00235243BE
DRVTFHDNLKVLRLLVTTKKVVGKKISELKELTAVGASISRVRRAGIDINPTPNLTLMLGDKLYITVPEKFEKRVTNFIGNNLLNFPAGDFLPISMGILIGMSIGFIPLNIPGFGYFKLSFVGGILLTALVLGRIGRTGKLVWQLSPHSTSLMKTLGQLIFMATIGTNAGAYLLQSINTLGFTSIYVALGTLLITYSAFTFVMFKMLKYNVLDILGVFSGSMTSTPALSMATEVCDSGRPSVAYAAVYPFALIITIFLAQAIL